MNRDMEGKQVQGNWSEQTYFPAKLCNAYVLDKENCIKQNRTSNYFTNRNALKQNLQRTIKLEIAWMKREPSKHDTCLWGTAISSDNNNR